MFCLFLIHHRFQICTKIRIIGKVNAAPILNILKITEAALIQGGFCGIEITNITVAVVVEPEFPEQLSAKSDSIFSLKLHRHFVWQHRQGN